MPMRQPHQLKYNNPGSMFLHCAKCLQEFYDGKFGKGQSPGEALSYEATGYLLKTGKNRMARIVVIWCKRCKRSIWDSRHLLPVSKQH